MRCKLNSINIATVDELSAQVKNYKAELKNLKKDLQNLSEKSDRMSLLGGSDRDIVRANNINHE